MSDSAEKDDAPKPFSALSFEVPHDPGTLSLSDSDPALSDDAEIESVSAEEEEDADEDRRPGGGLGSPLQPFILKGADMGFSQRSHGIFGALFDLQKGSPLAQVNKKGKQGVGSSSAPEVPASNPPAEVPASNPPAEVPAPNPPEEKEKPTLSSSTGGSSRRKRSTPTSRLPDYLAHPERWTKYSLEDVPDTSDRANRSTALNFLAELKQQKEAKGASKDPANPLPYNQDSSSSSEGRILFTKPQKKNQKDHEKSGAQPGQEHVASLWGDDGLEDAEGIGEQSKSESLGFHGAKKRSRKNLRQKADDKEEEDSS
ncbi:PREDICTED: protein TSSC4 [Nanorana parkeri]|uniref:protein TSSC4 n=1 Tax=Nanorana parkeri TaxID=125878 RepID=UPI000854D8AA|nr:PREDICTED: protein TSSC4 [Nanorana parkeri]